MGWHRDVAGMIEKYGSFRLESHDAKRMIESDELEAENAALRTALKESTELLRQVEAEAKILLPKYTDDKQAIADYERWVDQIAANEAAMKGGA